MAINEPELEAYAQWREQNGMKEPDVASLEQPIEIESADSAEPAAPAVEAEAEAEA